MILLCRKIKSWILGAGRNLETPSGSSSAPREWESLGIFHMPYPCFWSVPPDNLLSNNSSALCSVSPQSRLAGEGGEEAPWETEGGIHSLGLGRPLQVPESEPLFKCSVVGASLASP